MYDQVWNDVPPFQQAAALVAAAKNEDTLIREKLLVDVAEGLGLRVVVLAPDDPELSEKLLLDALAGLDEG